MKRLFALMSRLRAPGGCPWDKKQTLKSVKNYLIEETYETTSAIDDGQKEELCEEVGDLCIVIGLLLAIVAEKGWFTASDVEKGAISKMRRRHPHVFGKLKANNAQEALAHFQEAKEKERGHKGNGVFQDIGRGYPALIEAEKLQKKAAQVNFDWEKSEDVLLKVEEEIRELRLAIKSKKKDHIAEECGDLLFTCVSLIRHEGFHSELILQEANHKFRKRVERMEKEALQMGSPLGHEDWTPGKLESLWQSIK